MANEKHERLKERALCEAAEMFLENGFSATTLRGLASNLGVTTGAVVNLFPTKEDILSDLIEYALDGQFQTTARLIKGVTDDKILFYAAETTLQLHMAESNENIRSLYAAAYSMPKSSAAIQRNITDKFQYIFGDHLPELKKQDFYKLEIATGGIMRGFMTVPCDMWFTMDQKVEAFLETSLSIYKVGDEKIKEAIAFVSGFDFRKIAEETIANMSEFLKERKMKLI